ncbi:MFS transporter [Mycolicibacterium sp. 018/SC-01/001]|uniref:MFS transporter n=1 Tax=Mycolicibacterium sp. 018/SC-01/001 TaxID=2592069 RepID=UPI00118176F5|nr:MFS transporter [Mycolicibacterium sp. 018/SC-01/001]TRW79025.1 MFS transporter [Mycolicibacterium sp. 018/SC-01/001]
MKKIVRWSAVLILANVVADVVVGSPMMVIPHLLDRFDTDEGAWLTTSALLAGAIWSPLLAKAADVHGKRRMLVGTLLVACGGALLCVVAPTLWIFILGRVLQGAGYAAAFLTVALVVQVRPPREAMFVVGLVTSSSSVVGMIEPVLMTPVIERFGDRGVFVVAGLLSVVAAVGVAKVLPESPVRSAGRVDVPGALLLGGCLGGVLGYVSLGRDSGWLSAWPSVLLAAGLIALAGWLVRSYRIAEPIVDLRSLSRPVLLTLAALVLAGGAFRCLLHLFGVIGHVPAELDLGYGLAGAVAALFAVANLGIAVGGVTSGWLAGRIGPAATLLGGIALSAAATVAMTVGVSVLPVALACAAGLGAAAGAIGASGYIVATRHTAPERQGTVAGLVSVVMALGAAVLTIAGAEILEAATIPGAAVAGAKVCTAAGVLTYIGMAAVLLLAAAVPAAALARGRYAATGVVACSTASTSASARRCSKRW